MLKEFESFVTDLEVELSANFMAYREETNEKFNFIEITKMSNYYNEEMQTVFYTIISIFEYQDTANDMVKKFELEYVADILSVAKVAKELSKYALDVFEETRVTELYDEFDDFKRKREEGFYD